MGCEKTEGCQGITMPRSIKPAKPHKTLPSLAPHIKEKPCTGKTWCETFTTCSRGDKRKNFWAWTKAEGYQRYAGACADTKGKYGKRHKFWKGKHTYGQCRDKCDKMGKNCQGITMPTWIQNCAGPKMKKKETPKYVCQGKGYCAVYSTCSRGDHSNKWTFVKNKGYGMYKGACAKGKLAKHFKGKWTFERCLAKCNYMGKACQGITMPSRIKCYMKMPKKMPKKPVKPKKKAPPAKMTCKGKDWCETFHSCVKGDGRKFNAWVKAKSHKLWKGKHTYAQCKARCQKMGKACQGITMPPTVKCTFTKPKKKAKKKQPVKLTCKTTTVSTNNAGIVKAQAASKNHVILGGGMVNHYREWNARAGFEEALPEGNAYRCDTGFGPGKLTCYARSRQTNVGKLDCVTRRTTFKGSGFTEAHLPDGYVMTGGGLNNHYRGWDKRAGFEETRPIGNAWRGDMGFGWGKYSVYVRGCKAPRGRVLSCLTLQSAKGNYNKVTCPAGFAVTSCGVSNHIRKWNSKSGYESHFPVGNNQCHCDTAFGTGSNTCYARCCKLLDATLYDE